MLCSVISVCLSAESEMKPHPSKLPGLTLPSSSPASYPAGGSFRDEFGCLVPAEVVEHALCRMVWAGKDL